MSVLIAYTYFQLGNHIQEKEKVGEIIQAIPEDIVKKEIGEKAEESKRKKIAEKRVIVKVGEVKMERDVVKDNLIQGERI